MSKELFVSSTPHETKVAIVEDDQLAEIYFERENEYTLAGSIYKGKVTRVLPGMQSAFVDLGLERDAFLYVTDFLEEQEDVEVFDQVVTQAHDTAATGDAPGAPAPVEMDRQDRQERTERPDWQERPERPDRTERPERAFPAAEPGNQIERQPVSNAATIEGAGGDVVRPDRDGNRDDRGNRDGREGGPGGRSRGGRRRRGRRGRGGMPEERFAREGAPEQQAPEAPRGDAQPREPRMDRGEGRGSRDERPGGDDRGNRGNRGEQGYRGGGRGESQDRGERGGRGESQDRGGRGGGRGESPDRGGRGGGRGESPDRGGRPPAGYQPMVLPGESISKYRNIQPLPGESLSRPAGEPSARQREPEPAEAGELQAAHLAPPPIMPKRREEPREEPEERRFEQMNVAAVFGGDEATDAETPSSRDEMPSARHEAQPEARHETQTEAAAQGFGAGVVEEEEIEDEESDGLELDDELEGDEFEELEEETLEAENGGEEMIAAGSEVTDAVRDTHVEERATGHFESMDGEEGDEEDDADGNDFEALEGTDADADAEVLAEGEAGAETEVAEGGEGGAPDRAELRGPAGTAGFQQRTAERGPERGREGERGRDGGRGRFDRGGRGGRRGRRGRRPGGGGGGGRRNTLGAGRPQIHELLKEGQEILVQIAKEPMGKKGARITSHIALPGRFLVYMPTVAHIGVSRKIGSDEERQRLKRILLSEREDTKAHGGFIVRTAAAGASEDDLRADIRFLVNLWNEIKQRAETSKAPALIYHDLNLVERVLRDQVTQSFGQIWVDNEAEYERVLRFIGRFQPTLVKKVKLYTKEAPLYEAFGIQEEINKALKSKVWLKSGGYIVINQTEALVAIDVNTGKYVGKTGRLEDTIVKTNVDAIKEIVRQIRLRDLGGIIVIDFIDMDERRNRQKVMQALEEALRHDRAPSKVLQFNDFGLVAITRKRVKQSLERTLGQPCSYCTGTGLIKSVTTVSNEIYVEMRKMAKTIDKSDILLRVNPEVAKALKATGARWLAEMEELTSRTVIVKGDPTLHQEQFDIQ